MPKLTDTQLVILSAAAQRDDGAALPLPKSLKTRGAALTKALRDLLRTGLLVERTALPGAEAWREEPDGLRLALVITEAGFQAIDGGPIEKSVSRAEKKLKSTGKAHRRGGGKVTGSGSPNVEPAPMPRKGTKQALLVDLLKRNKGATIAEVVDATGWQPHSVRGAISGTLKKKLGLTVASETVARRGRVYRIVGAVQKAGR